MWFKNIRLYRFTRPFEATYESLEQSLAQSSFTPCGSQDVMQYGWVPPAGRGADQLVHASLGYWMVCARKEEKVLPATLIKEQVAEKVALLAEKEARTVARKERQAIKDDVILSLLPKALPKTRLIYAYFAATEGWLIVDSASAPLAEELMTALRESIGVLSLAPIKCTQEPGAVMTRWLSGEIDLPSVFQLGHEAELKDVSEEGGVIVCKQQELTSQEIQNHLAAGMMVSKLGLVWREGIECILDDELCIKRIRFLDKVIEKAKETDSDSQIEQFDVDFSVMAIELSEFIKDVCAAFGGVDECLPSVDEMLVQVAQSSRESNVQEEGLVTEC